MSGMEMLTKLRSEYPGTAIIIITAVNDIDTAVEAMRMGDSDYIAKPFGVNELMARVTVVLRRSEATEDQAGG